MFGEKGYQLIQNRVQRFALFEPSIYAALHDDVHKPAIDPSKHFAEIGLWQGREFTTNAKIVQLLEASFGTVPSTHDQLSPHLEAQILSRIGGFDIGVYVSSIGNFFLREIADLIVAGLRALGARVSLLDEHASIEDRPRCCIFIAPHEFFDLGRGREWAREDIISSSFMYSTEQVQTPWFRLGLPYILASKAVIDLNYQNCELIRSSGMPTLFYFPGFDVERPSDEHLLPDHPLAKALPRAAKERDISFDVWTSRPLDVVFLGTESPAREEFFSKAAAPFAKLSCFIHYVRLRQSPVLSRGAEARPSLNRYVCRRAKIVLNIHRSEVRYFEWHRMVMQGMWQKALVVSDPCLPHPIFKPGIHYLEESPRQIPQLIDWLLNTVEGRSTANRVRHEGFAALAERASSRRLSLALAQFLIQYCD